MFDLKVTITGICAFVENVLATGHRVCVVMPSTDIDRNAADDEPLCPHDSYLEQGLARMPLRGNRVSFDIQEVSPNPVLTSPLPTATSAAVGLIDFVASGTSSSPNPAMVSLTSVPPPPVMAQIILDKGYISFVPEGRDWQFKPAGPNLKVAHEVIVTLTQLQSAAVVLSPFNGSRPTKIDLTPPAGVLTVALRIVNTCLRRVSSSGDPSRDRDFKWYYELVLPIISITNDDLLIPRTPFQLIGGNNCFPTRLGVAVIQ
jgi:hypothetical protein